MDEIRAGLSGDAAHKAAARLLRAAGIKNASSDARWLLAWALGCSRDTLALVMPNPLDAAAAEKYRGALSKRIARVPVSRIVGQREFYGRTFRIAPDVLDPRPETECLVEAALISDFSRVLDIGTGTGCILLSLLCERPLATGVGVDCSAPACAVAEENADLLGLTNRAQIIQSDWLAGIEQKFDLIVANPPYISKSEMTRLEPEVFDHDPHLSLTPGGDGLGAYRSFLPKIRSYLLPKGRVIVEIGPGQSDAVAGLFTSAGLINVEILPDLDGRSRVVSGYKSHQA